ncbi:hypothetical protein C0992_011609 [Termitomyces sp. T32_za158]|nr:hypothetical protein C0992_011609 [Termitomyces sp. T32_za158]
MPTPGKATGRKAKEKDKGLELKERLEKAGNDEENWNIHKRRNQVRPEHKAPLTIRNRTLDYTKYARSVTMARARWKGYKREKMRGHRQAKVAVTARIPCEWILLA